MTNKTKFCGLTALVFLAFMAMSGAVSAASLAVSNVNFPSTIEHSAGSFPISFDITNGGAADSAIGFTLVMTSGTATLTMPNVPIGDGTTTSVMIHVSGTVSFTAFQDGNLAGKIIVDPAGLGDSRDVPFSVAINNKPSIKLTSKTVITPTTNGTIEVENNGNKDWSGVQLTSSGSFTVNFYDSSGNQITNLDLTAGQKKTVKVEGVGLDTVDFGGVSTTITATADDSITKANLILNVAGSFCEVGSVGGDLEIRNIKIDNQGNGDDNEWNLLDTIEIEVEIENTGNDKIKDIFVEMGVFDSDGINQVSDLNFDNADEEKFDLGSLSDGDKDTATFTFTVPADFTDGSYDLTFKAYSDDVGEDEQCIDTASDFEESDRFNSVDIERESDSGKFIAFDNIEFTPTEATCGDRISTTLDVYNIGDEDQDQVRINLKNTELGIDEFVEIRSGLDQGDKETINFDIAIPNNAKDKVYNLALSSEYDYNKGTYRQESDEDMSVQLRVIGCGTTSGNASTGGNRIVTISAELESDQVVAGGEVVVRATIANLKSQRTAFAVDALGYQSWATLESISPRIVDLDAGESKEVLLTFAVDEGVEGEQSFEIEVKDGLGGSELREIALNVGGTTQSGTGIFNLGDNSFLWIIGAVNVVLIILIIIVAVKVTRR
ncbi:putative S-layer protein [Candidatus Pacearchaeota archaeon]|nr:hypothetical protein [uncultured archaeon]AQS28844.1 hypothetical protein [uncultured archaeon]AQS29031.1 hypothetical protein [uncultured archaeon]MBS3076818.1 putative S-layer protein [Candidatus Pacearchaeota archaeon]